jgi:hypothetical protein
VLNVQVGILEVRFANIQIANPGSRQDMSIVPAWGVAVLHLNFDAGIRQFTGVQSAPSDYFKDCIVDHVSNLA